MTSPVWRKSSHSGAQQGDCVELAKLPGTIGIRDSKNPAAGHLIMSAEAFGSLLTEIKAGHLAV
jgi:uncharacterized protein DUF397